jgi:hypothetical protein
LVDSRINGGWRESFVLTAKGKKSGPLGTIAKLGAERKRKGEKTLIKSEVF